MARPEVTGRRTHRVAAESEPPVQHAGTEPADAALDDPFLNAGQVRQRYGGCSNMWLHRRLRDDSGFPQPDMVVSDRRFWRLSSLIRWEREQAARR